MKNLLVTLCILAVFVEVSGLLLSSKRDNPNEAFMRLSQPPDVRIESPLGNGYFLLLGLAAEPSNDPIQVGYEIWLEAEAAKGHRYFDLEKNGRGALRVSLDPSEIVAEWSDADPVRTLGGSDAVFRSTIERYAVLMKRYERWLGMAFEDWGFGHPGSPRANEMLVAHRLFVAAGFAHNPKMGLQRLYQDTVAWRRVLTEAKTLPLKMTAVTILDENVGLLSRALAHPSPDKSLLALARLVAHGLTAEESTLRWPIQHEFVLGLARRHDALLVDPYLHSQDADRTRKEIASLAGLHADAMDKVAHPRPKTIVGMSVESQRTWDAYATYYDATIKASEVLHRPLPRWSDVNHASSRTLLESVFTSSEFEPFWEPVTQRILEVDARLRLMGLQLELRGFSATDKIGERISLAGPQYFDPFSGLPMLWSAAQNRIYSVGKDGLDDGGDSTFDLVAPLSLSVSAPAVDRRAKPASSSRRS